MIDRRLLPGQMMFSGCLSVGPVIPAKQTYLLHMLYELLAFDKVYFFSKDLHQNKYQALLQDFDEQVNPEVGYEVIEAPGDEIIPIEELPVDNQMIVVFDDLVCKSNQNSIINSFINGRHRNCYVIYLTQTFYKVSFFHLRFQPSYEGNAIITIITFNFFVIKDPMYSLSEITPFHNFTLTEAPLGWPSIFLCHVFFTHSLTERNFCLNEN